MVYLGINLKFCNLVKFGIVMYEVMIMYNDVSIVWDLNFENMLLYLFVWIIFMYLLKVVSFMIEVEVNSLKFIRNVCML